MNNNMIVEKLTEKVFEKLISDKEVLIEERTEYSDGSGYNTSFIRKQAFSEITSSIFKKIVEMSDLFIKNLKIDFNKIFTEEIKNQFTKDDVKKIIADMFAQELDNAKKKAFSGSNREEIKKTIETEYYDYRQKSMEQKLIYRTRDLVNADLDKYLEDNKEKLEDIVKQGNKVTVVITPSPKQITL